MKADTPIIGTNFQVPSDRVRIISVLLLVALKRFVDILSADKKSMPNMLNTTILRELVDYIFEPISNQIDECTPEDALPYWVILEMCSQNG